MYITTIMQWIVKCNSISYHVMKFYHVSAYTLLSWSFQIWSYIAIYSKGICNMAMIHIVASLAHTPVHTCMYACTHTRAHTHAQHIYTATHMHCTIYNNNKLFILTELSTMHHWLWGVIISFVDIDSSIVYSHPHICPH